MAHAERNVRASDPRPYPALGPRSALGAVPVRSPGATPSRKHLRGGGSLAGDAFGDDRFRRLARVGRDCRRPLGVGPVRPSRCSARWRLRFIPGSASPLVSDLPPFDCEDEAYGGMWVSPDVEAARRSARCSARRIGPGSSWIAYAVDAPVAGRLGSSMTRLATPPRRSITLCTGGWSPAPRCCGAGPQRRRNPQGMMRLPRGVSRR